MSENKIEIEDDLENWIKLQHPDRIVTYMDRDFIFHFDVPNDKLFEFHEMEGIERCYLMLSVMSKNPKLKFEQVKKWPSTMVMYLFNELKKAMTASQSEILKPISSQSSPINPEVKSENGDTLKQNE